MKKFATVLLAVFFILSFTALTFAATNKGMESKLHRGSKNLLLGWTEIPKSVVSTSKSSNALIGITAGTLKGICQAFARTVSGAVDVVTCPVGAYDKPAIQPVMITNEKAKPEAPKPAAAVKPAGSVMK